MGFLEGVAAGLTVAAIVAAANWLRIAHNRETLRGKLRKVTCRHHRWQPIEKDPRVISLPDYQEECVRCGARR